MGTHSSDSLPNLSSAIELLSSIADPVARAAAVTMVNQAALAALTLYRVGRDAGTPDRPVQAAPEPPAGDDTPTGLPPLDRAMRLVLRRLKRGDATTAQLSEAADRTGKTISNWIAEDGPLYAWGARRASKGVYTWPSPQDIPLQDD
jgi:hypothetical protein